jgi:hypothetical protein
MLWPDATDAAADINPSIGTRIGHRAGLPLRPSRRGDEPDITGAYRFG